MDFGRKRKCRRSTSSKQKKIQALAKKAMKIHHKEGISLKAAWRRVMRKPTRFGYTPPELVDYEWNPRTKRYLKKCKDYQERNANGRCVGRAIQEPQASRRTGPRITPAPPALAGYEWNPRTKRYIKKCKDYQRRNANGRCVGRKPTRFGYNPPALQGYVWNERTKRYNKMRPSRRLPPRMTPNPPSLVDYEFVRGRYLKKCKDYQERNSKGRCVGKKARTSRSSRAVDGTGASSMNPIVKMDLDIVNVSGQSVSDWYMGWPSEARPRGVTGSLTSLRKHNHEQLVKYYKKYLKDALMSVPEFKSLKVYADFNKIKNRPQISVEISTKPSPRDIMDAVYDIEGVVLDCCVGAVPYPIKVKNGKIVSISSLKTSSGEYLTYPKVKQFDKTQVINFPTPGNVYIY